MLRRRPVWCFPVSRDDLADPKPPRKHEDDISPVAAFDGFDR